ncbi:hypothetical protein COU76_00895 [Candidatus Peregrinibacteria bacterium CG10_big_fil_rev_8_21_14_0_10_49_10]|nr:MAG: hypothetical protein COU76_00895 [Candidatus Peregrinibacteria bacterium CG10_big_fil_rev_8_21_14_0_10_49_10]
MSEASRQLSDEERAELKQQLTSKSASLRAETVGFKVRGQEMADGAVVAQTPTSLTDAELSVCGVKGFMIDEVRKFHREDGSSKEVDCASVAALDIIDSPVHVHGVTQEMYEILEGEGKMVLGKEVADVKKGSVVVLPPGIEHGLASNDPNTPVKVLLSFTPGIAPKTEPEFRDEAIVYERTSERIQQLLGSVRQSISDIDDSLVNT